MAFEPAPGVATLPAAPVSVDVRPDPSGATSRRTSRPRRIVAPWLVGAVGVAVGLGLGVAAPAPSRSTDARAVASSIPVSGGSGAASGSEGLDRAERVISAVLDSAPRCTPEVRMAGAPATEREGFLEEARHLAAEASEVQGLEYVRWRVIERDGRLFGVLYGERCS